MYTHFSSKFTPSLCPFLVVSIKAFLTECVPCACAVSFIFYILYRILFYILYLILSLTRLTYTVTLESVVTYSNNTLNTVARLLPEVC